MLAYILCVGASSSRERRSPCDGQRGLCQEIREETFDASGTRRPCGSRPAALGALAECSLTVPWPSLRPARPTSSLASSRKYSPLNSHVHRRSDTVFTQCKTTQAPRYFGCARPRVGRESGSPRKQASVLRPSGVWSTADTRESS